MCEGMCVGEGVFSPVWGLGHGGCHLPFTTEVKPQRLKEASSNKTLHRIIILAVFGSFLILTFSIVFFFSFWTKFSYWLLTFSQGWSVTVIYSSSVWNQEVSMCSLHLLCWGRDQFHVDLIIWTKLSEWRMVKTYVTKTHLRFSLLLRLIFQSWEGH